MRTFFLTLFGVCGFILLVPPALGASANGAAGFPPGTFFTVDLDNVLDHYHLAAPGQRLGSVNITGLGLQENIIGIDFRPATGQLYGLGSHDRLYIIDTVTGKATPVGSSFTPFLDDAAFGFDFNPTVDRVRVVGSTGQNLRLNPDTGQVVFVDAAINPVSAVEASAYTNNFAGTTSTTLYGIDPATDQLVIQSPPNNGTVTPVGPLGVDVGNNSGFDIAPGSNTAYAALLPGSVPSRLYTINLATGAAALVGVIAGGGSPVSGLAIVAGPETVFGVSSTNKLVSFRSNTPDSILSKFPITGLQLSENILGIDFRPATGELYGLGSTSRIYRINIVSGAATQVGTGTLTTPLNGTNFGFDFDATVDRIRVVSDTEQSIAINPDTAAVIVNGALNPGDPNVVAAAYTNNFAGAVSTSLYDMDSESDLLLTQVPATGTLTAVGPLGVDASGLTGFDIAPSGLAYASITLQAAASTNFYTVNLETGATTLRGTFGGGEVMRDTAARVYTEVVYAVTLVAGPAHNLIRFNAATPGIVISTVAITGLQAGETLFGIDFRPTSGQLFALGSTSRLYTINPVTGTATQVGTGVFTTPLNGITFGFDFNPSLDHISVVSDAEQSMSINPNTGAVTVNSNLTPAGSVVAAAYTNNFAGATATTLYDVDPFASQLFTQNTTTGLLTSVGSLGITVANSALGFDIARGTGNAYLSAYTGGINPGFFQVDLGTGTATLIGSVNTTEILIGISVLFELEEQIFSDGFE